MIRHIFHEMGFDNVPESENRSQHRNIITAFLLDRFPPNVLHRLNTMLGSKAAAALMRDYSRFASNEFYPENDWPTPPWDGAEALISKRSMNLMTILDSFKNALDRMLGGCGRLARARGFSIPVMRIAGRESV